MKKTILFILVSIAMYIYWQNFSTNNIKSEWRDSTQFTQTVTAGLLNMTVVYMCNNQEGNPSRSTISNSIDYAYKGIEPTSSSDKEVAVCFKKVLSKFTPRDVTQEVFANTNQKTIIKDYAASIK